jgi:trafficking protein particle complex subunit 8
MQYLSETFWVDVVLENPLDTEVNLSEVTVFVEELHSNEWISVKDSTQSEIIEDIILGPKETRLVRL